MANTLICHMSFGIIFEHGTFEQRRSEQKKRGVLDENFSKTPPGLRSHQNKIAKMFLRETHPVAICMGRQEKSKSSYEKWFTIAHNKLY